MEVRSIGSDEGAKTPAFAALLRRLRRRARLSQQALADRALVSVQAISALERGYRKAPYQETVDRLADAMALSSDARAALEEAAHQARSARLVETDAAPIHNLPRQVTSFVGRAKVVADVASLSKNNALVSLVATAGAGKTRTAVEVARHALDAFPDGVGFVELAPLNDPTLLTSALAGVLRVQETFGSALLETLLEFLKSKRILLVIDNCEHVINEARIVAGSLLRECPHVSMLVTSREALAIAGEHVYRLPPLDVPRQTTVTPDEAITYGAIALFADRASAADARFAVTKENVSDVVEICRRVDGLPLAIELAATRTPVLSPRQISQRLEHAFEVLQNENAALPRHQTMRTVIDWSYDLLSSHARLLFNRLSSFAGGFTLDCAIAVCADERLDRSDVLEVLTALVTQSMVMVDFSRGAARYYLLEAPRQYALERLKERGEQHRFAQRHALAYLTAAERLDRNWYVGDERHWLSEAEAELDNCRAALVWSLAERNDIRAGCRLAAALARVWYLLAPVEGRRWVRLALESLDDSVPASIVAALYVSDAELCGALGEHKASLASAERAILAIENSDDTLQIVRARKAAGNALSAMGRPSDGEGLLEDAMGGACQLDNRRLQAMILGDRGTARARRRDFAGAREFYAEALSIYSALGLERPAASIAGHLAEVEFAAGDPAAALQRALEAWRGHEATQNRRSAANDLSNMSAYLVALDRYDDAREYASRALHAAIELGATVLSTYALQHLAAVLALQPQTDDRRSSQARERATMLLGFVDARLQLLAAGREFTERQEYDRIRRALHSELADEKVHALMAQGETWTEEVAVAAALDA